jgi:hypothetical protein
MAKMDTVHPSPTYGGKSIAVDYLVSTGQSRFKSFAPEVLILVELKSIRMSAIGEKSQLQRCFLEVLIAVELRRRFSEVLILQGLGVRNEC